MIGLDTSFLVAFEIREHPRHVGAVEFARRRTEEGFGVAPQVLAEFIHVVTDARRLERPLGVDEAVRRARRWWLAKEVVQLLPTARSTLLFLEWMERFGLGRKRILDTQLAALYRSHGVTSVATTNARDFALFPVMAPIVIPQDR